MALRINLSDTFTIPVTVSIMGQDGKWRDQTFRPTFTRSTTQEIENLSRDKAREIIDAKLVGWSGIEDEHGNSLDYNDDNKTALLAIPAVVYAVFKAYTESHVKVKN